MKADDRVVTQHKKAGRRQIERSQVQLRHDGNGREIDILEPDTA